MDTVALATWNVKDLFEGPGLDAKLEHLAERLAALDADVVALQEIGSEPALARLAARLGYAPPMFATADARGIRNAALVRPGVGVRAWRVHTARHLDFPRFDPSDPPPFGERIPLRRGVLHVELAPLGLHVFVVHFKSGRPVPHDAGPT